MKRPSLKRNAFSAGLLFMIAVVALGTMAVGYGLWFKVLTIEGEVHTGSVDAELSLEEIDQGDDLLPIPDPLFWEGDSSCDADLAADDDCEIEGKDIAECEAELLDGLPNPGPQLLRVVVSHAYPSFHCWVQFNVENTGSIPIRVHQPVIANPNAAAVTVEVLPPGNHGPDPDNDSVCYHTVDIVPFPPPNDTRHPQLEPGEIAFCVLHIHVEQAAEQDAWYSFTASVCTHQWNEEPSAAFPCATVDQCAVAANDICVDLDGIASAQRGSIANMQAILGDPLTHWVPGPLGGFEGIDVFDNDLSGTWTAGDDLHLEDSGGSCATGVRNAVHDLGSDCKVLDIDGSLVSLQSVTCDLEGNSGFISPCPPLLAFFDQNGSKDYDNAEDIILDVNNNGVFD